MKIKFLVIGKTTPVYLSEAFAEYSARLVHYNKFSVDHLPDVKSTKSTDHNKLKELEAEAFMKKINPNDWVVLLDENGKQFTSEEFATQIQGWQLQHSSVVFIAGGAFGFGEQLYKRANQMMSLSKMTFSHQMVRMIFVEQLYRAFTIIKGEPYHHK